MTSSFGFEYRRVAEVEHLYVVPDHRHGRVATALLGEAMLWCRRQGVTDLEVVVTPNDPVKKDRVKVKDAASFGRPVRLWWRKRRLRCLTPGCRRGSLTERPGSIEPRARTTDRLRNQCARWVKMRPIEEVAREVGLSWRTVWRWTRPRIEASLAARGVTAPVRLGLDETNFRRPQRFATGMVDVDSGRLIDLVPARSQGAVTAWLSSPGSATDRISEAATDPYAGFLGQCGRPPLPKWSWTGST